DQVDLDDPSSDQATAAAQEVDALAVKPRDLTVVVPSAGHVVALGERSGDIERSGDRLGGAGYPAGGGEDVTGPDERLGRDATPVRALSPDQLSLDDGDRQTRVGTASRGRFPGRPGAYDDDVEGDLGIEGIRSRC